MVSVYLAGGFRSNWHEIVKQSCHHFRWLDPREKEYIGTQRLTLDVREYGQWDLHHIRVSDVVFVYVGRDNPSCIGLACEAGYAKGLGKTVILVLEPNHETIKDSYLAFITQVADITFPSLSEGAAFLQSFIK